MDKCLIHYFSGTGNTYHMVKTIKNQLISKGYEVNVLNIEKDENKIVADYELHIFCFPVYGFGTPSVMVRYISKLEAEERFKAAIICTSAGFEGQALNHVKYLLDKNGFEVFYSDMVLYTYNWTQILNPQTKEIEEKVFREAEVKIIEATEKIANYQTHFKKRNTIILLLCWFGFIMFSNFGRRILGKTYIADASCISCGKCKNICPVKAIDMNNGKPTWNWKCECCQRCINMCPQKSIQLSIVKLAIYVISELVPILIIIEINKYLVPLPIIINIVLYFIMVALNTGLADILICQMEKIKALKKLMYVNYTNKYRRNTAEGFNIN